MPSELVSRGELCKRLLTDPERLPFVEMNDNAEGGFDIPHAVPPAPVLPCARLSKIVQRRHCISCSV
jgi:hypothetical protein